MCADLSRADALFDAALDLDSAARRELLERECAGDPALRARVERLLGYADQHRRDGTATGTHGGPLWGGLLANISSGASAALKLADDDTATLDAAGDSKGFVGGLSGVFDTEPKVGDQVGELAIEERIATGGMGTVFRARHRATGDLVALKVLARHRVADPTARGRFLAEAQAVSTFEHPSLCQVLDAGEDETGLYLAMAYYPGATLAKRIAAGPLPIAQALDVARRLAEGLHHAHGKGVIHRDVKPSNILLPDNGGVKLLDFGIAKLEQATALTRPGFLIGTVAYVSPEQARGRSVDPRTDVWSLGVVLFEMLTGVKPFDEATPQATLKAIVRQPPPPLDAHRADVPGAIQALLDRLLAKDRRQRPADAERLASELAALGD